MSWLIRLKRIWYLLFCKGDVVLFVWLLIRLIFKRRNCKRGIVSKKVKVKFLVLVEVMDWWDSFIVINNKMNMLIINNDVCDFVKNRVIL